MPSAEAPVVATKPVTNDDARGDCVASTSRTITVAMRPHSDERFGELDASTPVTITARSKDGWLGFDPGVAQAANVGPFRLRWVDPSTVTTHGDCMHVPEAWTPKPGVCFEMTMEDVVVRDAPRADARAVVTLHRDEFAALGERAGKAWVKVELGPGNTGSSASGFIPIDAVNMNGPCSSLQP